ncbi:hypothetical protein HDV05_006067 [Chytridiales sp. JEL 0842]|nr:hypothetical protein HDV05_006067 [Chytridiales sp. JEL 0842]
MLATTSESQQPDDNVTVDSSCVSALADSLKTLKVQTVTDDDTKDVSLAPPPLSVGDLEDGELPSQTVLQGESIDGADAAEEGELPAESTMEPILTTTTLKTDESNQEPQSFILRLSSPVPYNLTPRALRRRFEVFGPVLRAGIVSEKDVELGWVQFEDAVGLMTAIESLETERFSNVQEAQGYDENNSRAEPNNREGGTETKVVVAIKERGSDELQVVEPKAKIVIKERETVPLNLSKPIHSMAESKTDVMKETYVYIPNLPPSMTAAKLSPLFKPFTPAPLPSPTIQIIQRSSGNAFAILKFPNPESALAARASIGGTEPLMDGSRLVLEDPTWRKGVKVSGGLNPNTKLTSLMDAFDEFGEVRAARFVKGGIGSEEEFEVRVEFVEEGCAVKAVEGMEGREVELQLKGGAVEMMKLRVELI